MTRRSVLELFSAALARCGLGDAAESPAEATRQRYGPMTVARHRALCQRGVHLHVWHRGQDVTRRCTFADDTGEGMAELLVLTAAGERYLRPAFDSWKHEQEVAKEIVYDVTFKEGEPFE